MFFTFMRGVIRVILFVVNGNAHYEQRKLLPNDENYILVAPHRTWWDPLYLAIAARRVVQKSGFTIYFGEIQCISCET
jgi:1-acyl-sn-glycerol-3-phosphate acyltransferase